MRRALCGILFALALAGCHHHRYGIEPDAPPVGAMLTGQWTPVSAEMGGKDFPVANFGGASLRMTASTYDFAGDSGTYDVLSQGMPARMDIHGVQGPNAGRLIPALYEASGDQLTVSYQMGPGVRPKDFGSPPGSKILVIHYRRAH
jgi:uncharacterized protein (TIGR03067 family)